MLTITKEEHLTMLDRSRALPAPFRSYLEKEFGALSEELNYERLAPFSLEDHGHRMVVLEPGDNFHRLPITGSGHLDLLDSLPEYAELTPLPDGWSMYRVCFLPDNESCLLMYILNDTLDPKLERWLAEQAGLFTGEEVQ